MSNRRNYFSIVIPLYNKEANIADTVNSVLNQTYSHFELIIVNDGSTDNSLKVVQSIKDERIRIIDKENGGVSSARNYGIKEAKHNWISLLDGDDIWYPDYLKMVLSMIDKYPKANIIAVGWKYDNATNQNKYDAEGYIDDYFKLSINYAGLLWSSAVAIKKECFNIVGFFREDLSRGEDLEMWIRLAKNFKIAYLPDIYAIYTTQAANRACKIDNSINQVLLFFSLLNMENSHGYEKKYYKHLLHKKCINLIVSKDFKTFIKLIKSYNLDILF